MIQLSFLLACHLLVHKLVLIGGVVFSASTLVFPFTYFFGDVIAEVYGYKVSRQLIWATFFCMLLFDLIPALLIRLPSPAFWHFGPDYSTVVGQLPRTFLGDFIAINVGQFVNVYALTKLKVLMNGRNFPLRSLLSTLIGEGVFTILAFMIMFFGVNNIHVIIEAMLFSYIFKAICAFVAVYPAYLFSNYLKYTEQIDVFDVSTNFNPFSLEV